MSFKIPRMLLQSLILLLFFSSLFTAYAAQPVSDISTHWAKTEIILANEQGWALIQNGKFNPNKSATREEVVWMLIGACKASKYEGFDITKKTDLAKFKDKASDWAADRMAIAIAHGYIKGYPDNTIRAKNPITRAEFAVLLSRLVKDYKFAGFLPFRDYIPAWAMDGIKTAYGTGIIKGYTDNSFKAEANVTKAEALVMIKRWADAGKTIDEPILSTEDEKKLMEANIIDGPFLLTNEEFKKEVSNYSVYVDAAKEYMELHHNYNYKELVSETGKEKFEAGLNKYSPDPEYYQDKTNRDRIANIISHKMIKKSVFVTSDNCVFENGNRTTTVRGILYFTYLEKEGALEMYEKEVEYKVDTEVYLSGSPDPKQLKVIGHNTLGDAVKSN